MNAWAIARRAVALAVVGLVLGAGPATADPARPGRYSSEVTSVSPDPGTFSVDTAGGDSFLELTVDEGTEVVVLGYEGEEYLRFNADGTVEENQRSPATYINEERFGTNELAPDELVGADVTTLEPVWEQVATGGSFAWHDHRTHFMGGEAPPAGTLDWEVPLVVDGEDIVVAGVIADEGSTRTVAWLGLVVLAVAAVAALGLQVGDTAPPAAVTAVALAAAVVAWLGYSAQPPDTGASVVPTVIALVAVALGLVALLVPRLRPVALLAAGVFLATWGVFRFSVLTNPVLPTDVPFVLERVVTALALGGGVGAVVVAFRSGALGTALLSLDDDEPGDEPGSEPTPA